VATRIQSILHASNAGGVPGAGTGGQAGPGPAGAGGTGGPGSISHALGTGLGSGVDVDPRDKRRTEYGRQLRNKVAAHTQEHQVFPRSAAYAGVAGIVIITIRILADGSVAGAWITRSSGIPELDENCRRGALKAAPFPPVPPELGRTFTMAFSLDYTNAAVRPPAAKAEPAGG
jgi:TonB family protein